MTRMISIKVDVLGVSLKKYFEWRSAPTFNEQFPLDASLLEAYIKTGKSLFPDGQAQRDQWEDTVIQMAIRKEIELTENQLYQLGWINSDVDIVGAGCEM